jgi:hypothetical protein
MMHVLEHSAAGTGHWHTLSISEYSQYKKKRVTVRPKIHKKERAGCIFYIYLFLFFSFFIFIESPKNYRLIKWTNIKYFL